MKKALALLTVFLVLFLISCSEGTETTDVTTADNQNLIESITEKIIESVTDSELCSVPEAPDGFVLMTDVYGSACIPPTCGNATFVTSDYLPCAKTLSTDDEEFVREILKGDWREGAEDCAYDGTIYCVAFAHYYNSERGTLTDIVNQRSMHLTKSQVHRLNVIISKYDTGGKNAVLSRSIVSKDGMKLTVELSENPVKSGDDFVLTATVFNNTGRTAYVGLPTGTPNMHFEIDVKITDGRYSFTDLDTQGKCYTTDEGLLVLEDGESYTQKMNMAAGYLLDGSMPPGMESMNDFGQGTYSGTATFNWHYDKFPDNDMKTLKLDFDVQVK